MKLFEAPRSWHHLTRPAHDVTTMLRDCRAQNKIRVSYALGVRQKGRAIRFGPPRSPVANLSPPCRLPVAVLALLAPCRSPVACLSLSCRSPVAPLSLPCRFPVAFLPPSCRYPVASCRFLLFPVAILNFAPRLPVALLSLSCRSLLSLSCRSFLLPPCRPPVACLSSSRGGPGHGTLRWTRTCEQAGKALRSQGHYYARVM